MDAAKFSPHERRVLEKGSLSSEDFNKYMDVIESALAVHIDREEIRKGLWKQYGADEQMRQVKIKVERVIHALPSIEARKYDDPLVVQTIAEIDDIINYAVFAKRKMLGVD